MQETAKDPGGSGSVEEKGLGPAGSVVCPPHWFSGALMYSVGSCCKVVVVVVAVVAVVVVVVFVVFVVGADDKRWGGVHGIGVPAETIGEEPG